LSYSASYAACDKTGGQEHPELQRIHAAHRRDEASSPSRRTLPPVLVVGEDAEVCAWLATAAADAALDLIGK
jgi:hypothetical protein